MSDQYAIVLFDGQCAFCDRAVKWIIAHDRHARLRFAARQSATGQRLLAAHGLPPEGVGSMILIDSGRVSTHSTGVLRIAGKLGFPWKLASMFLLIPRFIRDAGYNFIARRRQRLSRGAACALPTPAERARILDDVSGPAEPSRA